MDRRGRIALFLVLLAAAFLPSAFSEDLVDPAMVESQNKFGLKVFQKLAEQNADKNVLFAPLQTGALLRMFYDAAAGQTQKEMASVLETGAMTQEEVFNRGAGLWMLSQNTEKEEVEFLSPLTFLGSQDTHFTDDFARRTLFYKMKPMSYDFHHPYMTATIMDWIQKSTKRKIQNVTSYFDPDSKVVLLDGFYFKGKWAVPLRDRRKPHPFTAASGIEKPTTFMTASAPFEFYKDDHFEAVNLRYSTGRYSLYVFLPDAGKKLAEFLSSLREEKIQNWISGFLERPGTVNLPKFRAQNNWDLRPVLQLLGMKTAFEPQADFKQAFLVDSGPGPLGSVEQAAVFEAYEDAVPKPPPLVEEDEAISSGDHFTLTAGRPFFYIIRDNKTGVWLALGAVSEF